MANGRKVLMLSETAGWAGGAAQLLALSEGLRQKGWNVTAACPEGGDLDKRLKAAGFETFRFSPFQDYDVSTAAGLAAEIDRLNPDVIHAHHPKAHAMGLIALYLCKSKPVFMVSRRVSHPFRRNIFSLLKYKNKKISCYIAVAGHIARRLSEYGISEDKIETIYSGVDTAGFFPRPPDETLLRELSPGGAPVVAMIGNFSEDKGQKVLLAAAKIIYARGLKPVFVFAGRDTDSAELKNSTLETGLPPGAFRFLGLRGDVPEILSVSAVSVNAAIKGEALSGAMRESLAMKVPVAASDIAGNSELVKHEETGLLFPPGDSALLAGHIERYLKKPGYARGLAEKGLKLVLEKFTLAEMISRTEECYLRRL